MACCVHSEGGDGLKLHEGLQHLPWNLPWNQAM